MQPRLAAETWPHQHVPIDRTTSLNNLQDPLHFIVIELLHRSKVRGIDHVGAHPRNRFIGHSELYLQQRDVLEAYRSRRPGNGNPDL